MFAFRGFWCFCVLRTLFCSLNYVLRVCLCALSAQALQDPGVYGVIQSGDHKGRTCVVKWIKLNSSSDDVEVGQGDKTTVFVL